MNRYIHTYIDIDMYIYICIYIYIYAYIDSYMIPSNSQFYFSLFTMTGAAYGDA